MLGGHFLLAAIEQLSLSLFLFAFFLAFTLSMGFLLTAIFFRKTKEKLVKQHKYLVLQHEKDQAKLVELFSFRERLVGELDLDNTSIFDPFTAAYIKQIIYQVRDYLPLKVDEISIQSLATTILDEVKVQGIDPALKLVVEVRTSQEVLQADIGKIRELLSNSIVYLQKYHGVQLPIRVMIEDTLLGYGLCDVRDYFKKIAAIRMVVATPGPTPHLESVYIHPSFDQSPEQRMPITVEGLPLLENARIIEAHYGYMDQTSKERHVYVIPLSVREVRAKVMDLTRKPGVDPLEISHPLAMELEERLLHKVAEKGMELEVIQCALEMIKRYHGGVKRRAGEPYFTHPLGVALIVLAYSEEQGAVVAALLHDIVEDTGLTLSHLQVMFGERVGFIVSQVSNLESQLKKIKLASHENLVRIAGSKDVGVILVKVADWLHNMRAIGDSSSLRKRKKIARNTIGFIVPLARLMKLDEIALQLEELSLSILNK